MSKGSNLSSKIRFQKEEVKCLETEVEEESVWGNFSKGAMEFLGMIISAKGS